MKRKITIEADAYDLLVSMKESPGDSFTKVIRRHFFKPVENAGKLIAIYEKLPPPNVDLKILGKMMRSRGRGRPAKAI